MTAWLVEQGHDATHTLDLPLANRTPDAEITALAERENRIVISKDSDFVQSFLIEGRPPRLLLVSTGNIGNAELEKLVRARLRGITDAFTTHHFVEITADALVIHE
jgi:predicted nuclease of predicted toxin-antitoxin system